MEGGGGGAVWNAWQRQTFGSGCKIYEYKTIGPVRASMRSVVCPVLLNRHISRKINGVHSAAATRSPPPPNHYTAFHSLNIRSMSSL